MCTHPLLPQSISLPIPLPSTTLNKQLSSSLFQVNKCLDQWIFKAIQHNKRHILVYQLSMTFLVLQSAIEWSVTYLVLQKRYPLVQGQLKLFDDHVMIVAQEDFTFHIMYIGIHTKYTPHDCSVKVQAFQHLPSFKASTLYRQYVIPTSQLYQMTSRVFVNGTIASESKDVNSTIPKAR